MTAPGGGTSRLRVGGLALIGVAVVAAIIGLASMATNGAPSPTAAPQPAGSSTDRAPEVVPPPALPPAEPVPTGDGAVPAPPPGEPAPGAAPPPEQAPAPGDEPAPGPGPGPAPDGPPADPGAPGAAEAPAPGAPGQADAGGNPPAAAPVAPGGNGGSGVRSGDVSGGAGKGGSSASAVHAPLRVYNNSTISGLAARAAEDFRRAGWPIDEVGNYPHGIIPTTTVYFRPGTDEEAPARALAEQFGMRVNPRFEGLKEASPGIIVIVTNDYGR